MQENPGPQIVYLILAHGEPTLLARLVQALDHERVQFFIHVDAKSDITPFTHSFSANHNVSFIADRVKVYWGGFSMVEATLRLMRAALDEVPDFGYAVLISGVHYPIKSNDYILGMLGNVDDQYLQYARVSEVGCHFKINTFCLYDHPLFNPRTVFSRNKMLNLAAKLPGRLADIFFRKLVPLVYRRTPPEDITPFTGANWWALTRPCIQYVLNYLTDHPGYEAFFRYSVQPDETFFHTIVCSSPFKLANDDITLASLSGRAEGSGKYAQLRGLSLTFTKCAADGSPKVLDADDFPEIRAEMNYYCFPQLFARKFDKRASAELLQLIDTAVIHKQD